jgi:O-antigen/teichoic acid export membrane protein
MTEKPAVPKLTAWLEAHNWVYWALAIGGVVAIIIVAYYLLRKKPQGATKA